MKNNTGKTSTSGNYIY